MTKYVAIHQVGPHMEGEAFDITPKHEEDGVDVDRLLALGAVRKAEGAEAKSAVPYGQPTGDYYRPIPVVPYDPQTPGASPDPNRAESPPTNPSPIAPTTPIGGDLSNEPDEGDVAQARERAANPVAAEKKSK